MQTVTAALENIWKIFKRWFCFVAGIRFETRYIKKTILTNFTYGFLLDNVKCFASVRVIN